MKILKTLPTDDDLRTTDKNMFTGIIEGLGTISAIRPAGQGRRLTVEADYLQIGWSSYDELAVEFETQTDAVQNMSEEKLWEDVYSLRFGLEYRWDEQLSLRTGFMLDYDPAPDETLDPSLPSADRTLFSLGGGYNFGEVTVDAAWMILFQEDREITTSHIPFNGKYESMANLFSLSLSYAIQ